MGAPCRPAKTDAQAQQPFYPQKLWISGAAQRLRDPASPAKTPLPKNQAEKNFFAFCTYAKESGSARDARKTRSARNGDSPVM
jgi:hypothetical protein